MKRKVKDKRWRLMTLAFIEVIVICLVGQIAVFLILYRSPNTKANTSSRTGTLTEFLAEGDTVYITSPDGNTYELCEVPEGYDTAAIEGVCDGRTTVTVYYATYYRKSLLKSKEACFSVKAIYDADKCILSFEEVDGWAVLRIGVWRYTPVFVLIFAVIAYSSLVLIKKKKRGVSDMTPDKDA